jgi:hypothetical protein
LQAAYGYDPLVVTTCSPDDALTNGIVFCQVKSWLTGRRLVSLPFSDHCEPLVNSLSELDDLLLHVRQYVDAGKWKYLEIRPTSCEPGHRIGLGRGIRYSLHSLDLRTSTEALFRSFHKDCVQRKIRRSQRENLRYEEGISETMLHKFYNLLMITRRRHLLPPQPLSWFRALIASLGDNAKIRVASKGDLPVASILTISHKKSMVYKYGCSDERYHRLGGTALLFWNAIQDAKDKGCEEFEMGRSDTRNRGLITFKEHWGAIGAELSYWRYPHKDEVARIDWQKVMLRKLAPVAPDAVLKLAGQLLYRHIG